MTVTEVAPLPAGIVQLGDIELGNEAAFHLDPARHVGIEEVSEFFKEHCADPTRPTPISLDRVGLAYLSRELVSRKGLSYIDLKIIPAARALERGLPRRQLSVYETQNGEEFGFDRFYGGLYLASEVRKQNRHVLPLGIDNYYTFYASLARRRAQ